MRLRSFTLALLLALASAVTARADGPQKLVLVGGGPRPADAMARFVGWAGGAESKTLVVGWASEGYAKEVCEEIARDLRPHGAKNFLFSHSPPKTQAEFEAFLKLLEESTAVFFSGGDQVRAMAPFLNRKLPFKLGPRYSRLYDALLARYEAGMPVAGTSAGTAMQSREMISGNVITDLKRLRSRYRNRAYLPKQAPGVAPLDWGLGFVPDDVTLDMHFHKRKRWRRLVPLVEARPGTIGLGIEEGGAVAITGRTRLEVLGELPVMVVDPSKRDANGKILTPDIHPGDRLDFSTRTIMLAPKAPCSPEGVGRLLQKP